MRQVSHDSHTVGTRRHGSRRELGRLVLGLVAALGVLCSAATPALANNALVLDGVDDYVTIVGDPAILKQTGAITVEAWFKHPNAAVAPPAVIASKAGAGGPSWVLDLTETGTLEFIAFGGAGTTPSFATTTQLLNDGQWHHAAAVWNESGARLYIDGTLDGEDTSGTSGPPLFDTTDPVVVGADATLAAGPTLFTGEIDEVRIWNIARSNGEISATMNTTLVGTETNLVGYWNFDDGTANDVTPNGSHGTVGGGAAIAASDTPVSGGGGGAAGDNSILLDGVDDYVIMAGDPAALKLTGAMTIEAWFKHPAVDVAWPAVIASKAGPGGASWVLDLSSVDGNLEFIAFGGNGASPSGALTAQNLNDGLWHHAAGVWDGSEPRLYIDGALAATGPTTTGPLFDTTDSVAIGNDAALAAATAFAGEIDEVRIWDVARSVAEIGATMSTTLVGDETNLVGYWNFDDGTADDVTVSGSHGTVGGGAVIAASDTPLSGGGGGAAGDNSILLDGVDDHVTMAGDPAALKLTGAMTIEAWFKHPAVDVAWPAVIASKAGAGGASWVMDLSSVDGNLEFIAFGGNGASPSGALTAQNLNDGLWHHAAGVWDGSEPRLYIDGALAATGPTTTGPLFDTTASVAIGNDAALAAATAFAGEIDEVRIWDVARSQVDIQTDMNTTLVGDETNLVGYWNFDDGTGNDVTLNGSHGTVGGGAVIAASDTPLSGGGGAAGANSVLLDGVDDHVIMAGDPAALKLTGPMTVEAWFKHPTGAVASPAVIASKAAPENVSWVMDLWDTDGRLEFGAFGDGVAPSFAQSVQTVNDGLWHHAAGVWDGFEARLYIDGVLDGVGTTEAAPLTDSTSEVVIGNDAALAAAAAFLGEIDEVRMWDVARSQVDIQNDMNATLVGNETNLVGYWNFDAGTADDLVGASHGTLGGGATLVTSEAPLSGGAAPAVQALALDGVDDYVDVADIADYDLNITSGSGLTVETWFRTSAASLPDNALVFKWDSSDASYALHWGGHARSAVRHTGRRHPTDRGLIPAIQRWVLAPRGRSMAGRHGDALRGRHRCWV